MQKNKFLKITAVVIFFSLVSTSAVQAVVKSDVASKESTSNGDKGGAPLSYGIWDDDFNDTTKIDPSPPGAGASDHYTVGNSKATMINTYSVWTDPAWTRMKLINVTNSGGQVLTDYALQLLINHESGMQSAYQDIRFKYDGDPNTWLGYWIELYNATVATVWVKIPSIPIGTSTIYLFYGNPSATSQSNFDNVFSWQVNWADDQKISYHADTKEGAWDPDVAFGNGEFMVGWEQGQPYWPLHGCLGFKQSIFASVYDSNGTILVTQNLVFNDGTTYYRNENPSIDYGGGKFFIAWQHWDPVIGNPSDDTLDIKARTAVRSGDQLQLGSVIDVCNEAHCQADANVQFDSVNNRFCVAWEDARTGTSNYDVWGRLYDTNGNPVGNQVDLTNSETYSQCEPWLAFDPIHQHYMLVYESGIAADTGPFSIEARIFDKDLNQIGSTITIATGSDSVDYNFPCVEFSQDTQRFLVTWNQDDISSGDWWGTVWGKILDTSGNVVVDTFEIKSGEFVRTDIVPYLSSLFFVSFNSQGTSGSGLIYGKLVAFDGTVSANDVQLSASTNAQADWANLAVGNGRIFTAWEDIRVDYPSPWNDMPDVYGNLWWLKMAGSSVTYAIGTETQIVLTANVTSVKITPTNFNKWNIFDATYSDGTITFDVLDGTTGTLLLQGVSPGTNLYNQGVTASTIRLKAKFTRTNPSTTPKLDKWSIKWDLNDPPNTPSNPNPANGSTDVSVNATLSWTGGDPNGDPVTYDVYFGTSSSPPKVVNNQSDTTYNPGTIGYGTMYYWKIVAWDNLGASTVGPLWHFTTHNDPPNTPSNPNPANHATGVNISATLSWTGGDPNGDPVTYDVYFGTSSSPPKVVSNQSNTTYSPGTMNYVTTYYWKIVAWDNHGASTIGPVWNFTTEFVPDNPPYEPSNPNPANNSTGVDINADLSWNGGDPDPGDTVTYDIYFGTNNPPPLVAYNYSATSYDPGAMNYVTTYYWKIVAWDNRGGTTPGPVWDFTTKQGVNNPPYLPSDPNPANYATGVGINADLSWNGGDPDSGDTVTYDVYFGTSSSPPKVVSNQSGTTYDPGTMNFSTMYYWKIVAWDNHGASTVGSVWAFTTEVNNPPQNPSQPSGPTSGYICISYNFSTSTTDPEGDNVKYGWDWNGDLTVDEWTGWYLSGAVCTTSHIWNDPSTYYVRVKAKDTFDHESNWSDPLIIVIENHPPNTPSNPNPANGATDVTVNADLSWTGGDQDSCDTVTYDVYFGTSSSPPKVVSNQSGTTYDPGTMNFSTMYYWKIVAWDNHGASTSGPLWTFTTKVNNPPNTPNTPYPSNGEMEVDVNANLRWSGGDPDQGDTVTYDVYFGTTSPPPQVADNQSATSFDPGTMDTNTTYYWKIVAWDDKGVSSEGPIWWFKTIEQSNNNPPNKPTIRSTSQDSGVIIIKPNVNYEFDVVASDPDGDNIYYYVDWGDGTNTGWLGPFPTSESILVNHTWSSGIKIGSIKAKVKDIHDAESDWGYLYYIINKGVSSRFSIILEKFLQHFISKFNPERIRLILLTIALIIQLGKNRN